MSSDLSSVLQVMNRVDSKVTLLKETKTNLEKKISFLREEEKLLTQVNLVYQKMIDDCLVENKEVLQDLMREAIITIFPDLNLNIEVQVGLERKKVSMDIITITTTMDGRVIKGIANESFGGSLATIQSLVLRILVALKRGLRRVIFVDEGLAALDDDYAVRAGNFLKTLCTKLGIDILLITQSKVMFDEGNTRYIASPVKGNVVFRRL